MMRAVARFEAEQERTRLAQQRAVAKARSRQLAEQRAARSAGEPTGPIAAELKASKPLRAAGAGADPSLGPASAQVFAGEDGRAAEREALQAAQMRRWCLEGAEARKEEEEARKEEDRREREKLDYYCLQRDAFREDEAKRAQERRDAMREANIRLAQQKRRDAARRTEEERRADEAGMAGTLPGILEQRMEDAESALGPGRIRREYFRGRGFDARAAAAEAMLEQAREKAEAKAREKAEEEADLRERQLQLAKLKRFELEGQRAEQEKKRAYLQALAKQQDERKARERAE